MSNKRIANTKHNVHTTNGEPTFQLKDMERKLLEQPQEIRIVNFKISSNETSYFALSNKPNLQDNFIGNHVSVVLRCWCFVQNFC